MAWIEKYYKRILFTIIVSSFLISLGYSFYFLLEPAVDARAYDEIAWNIAQGHGYSNDAINRPGPGYEFFLALIYSVFWHSYAAVWVIQAVLLAFTAYLAFAISRLIFGEMWHPIMGLLTSVFVGFSPDLITTTAMLMTEALVVFLVIATVYLFMAGVTYEKKWYFLFAGIVVTLTALTRSNTIFLILPFLGWFLYKRKWITGLFFLAVVLLCLSPWTVRNYKIFHEVRPFNGAYGLIYVGNHAGASGELDLNYPIPPVAGDFNALSQIEQDRVLRRAGIDFIKQHPLSFLKLTLLRTSIYFSAARPYAFWPHLQGSLRLLMIVVSSFSAIILFLFGAVGFFFAIRTSQLRIQAMSILLGVSVIALSLGVVWLIIETRYRFPIYPLLAVFAGFGLWRCVRDRKILFQEWKIILFIAGVFFGNTLFDAVRNLGRIFGK